MEELDLGKERIGKLIAKFSIPCVISMIVAALYNIVDQIFIGWSEAGAYGNAATNIVYPFTVLALGLALLIGDGAAAGFSIALGMDNRKILDEGNISISNDYTSFNCPQKMNKFLYIMFQFVVGDRIASCFPILNCFDELIYSPEISDFTWMVFIVTLNVQIYRFSIVINSIRIQFLPAVFIYALH
ncbi:MAG: hypothetical protein IJ757_06100 [Clostridiales bacterium]|nr:hypothetical protein [Clostridiales bacterium]